MIFTHTHRVIGDLGSISLSTIINKAKIQIAPWETNQSPPRQQFRALGALEDPWLRWKDPILPKRRGAVEWCVTMFFNLTLHSCVVIPWYYSICIIIWSYVHTCMYTDWYVMIWYDVYIYIYIKICIHTYAWWVRVFTSLTKVWLWRVSPSRLGSCGRRPAVPTLEGFEFPMCSALRNESFTEACAAQRGTKLHGTGPRFPLSPFSPFSPWPCHNERNWLCAATSSPTIFLC